MKSNKEYLNGKYLNEEYLEINEKILLKDMIIINNLFQSNSYKFNKNSLFMKIFFQYFKNIDFKFEYDAIDPDKELYFFNEYRIHSLTKIFIEYFQKKIIKINFKQFKTQEYFDLNFIYLIENKLKRKII